MKKWHGMAGAALLGLLPLQGAWAQFPQPNPPRRGRPDPVAPGPPGPGP